MIKINAFDKMICRTPAFAVNQQLPAIWEELKAKIEESSPSFYAIIKDVEVSELAQLDDKIRFTIWKYFNRAKYRSTPFGSLAAISLMDVGLNSEQQVKLSQKMELHHFTDWSHKISYLPTDLSKITSLISNSTVYMVDQEIRYIQAKDGVFELASVAAIPQLCNLILFCKQKKSINEILELMKYSFNYDGDSTKALLKQMIDLQLLFSDQHPNLIGADYFTRLGISCKAHSSNYIMAERKVYQGCFDGALIQHLPSLIHRMQELLAIGKNDNLEVFKQSFVKRFEQRKINLAMVLDPELGIGYGNLAQPVDTDPLVVEIESYVNSPISPQIAYGALQQFLLSKIVIGDTIKLEDFKGENQGLRGSLPNTFSVMFNVHEEQLVLASVGGTSANVLLGRFTNCGTDWEKYGLEIAQLEQNANAEVEFFDIGYQAERKVDNVNRRKQLYANELPILSWTGVEAALHLNDILVSVERDEVILRSKISGKRLMPRLASAYNYTRSDLAVYRFLCDIQTQGLAVNLNFSLATFFPKLSHYPRVCYQDIIVARATWLIPLNVLENERSLFNWLATQEVSKQLIVGDSDQSLYFDLTQDEHVWAFLKYGKQQDVDFYVKEALIGHNDLISDEDGKGYYPQYIVNYYHSELIYEEKKYVHTSDEQPFYLPGSNWLYIALYCHISYGNRLLMAINRFIKANKPKLRNWFFIRYADPKPHIRLRLKLKDEALGCQMLAALRKLAEPAIGKGYISDIQVRTYQPELDRYGAERMPLVEQFFGFDSNYVAWMIGKYPEEAHLKSHALATLKEMCSIAFPTLEDQLIFAKSMASSFAKEMGLDAKLFKKINVSYNDLKPLSERSNALLNSSKSKKRNELLAVILKQCENDTVKRTLLADLIHMHVNRLFSGTQRVHETILYQFLARSLQTELSLAKGKPAL